MAAENWSCTETAGPALENAEVVVWGSVAVGVTKWPGGAGTGGRGGGGGGAGAGGRVGAVSGMRTDAYELVGEAQTSGAVAFLLERQVPIPQGAAAAIVDDYRLALGVAASSLAA